MARTPQTIIRTGSAFFHAGVYDRDKVDAWSRIPTLCGRTGARTIIEHPLTSVDCKTCRAVLKRIRALP